MIVAVAITASVRFADGDQLGGNLRVAQVLNIGLVPASFPVDFCLLTHGERQYVAYYDQHHQMTVAARDLSEDQWTYQTLPSRIWWDSHNYVAMAVDRDGHLHVCGNMHSSRLVYFRTTKPHDIASLERVSRMTGDDENLCTYPAFLSCPDGSLTFIYRSGRSGNGKRLLNKYDTKTRTWRRLSKPALIDGLGEMNAYPDGPVLGPDGNYHMAWVWRDSFDCSTNHDVCYARSSDLVNWEMPWGKPCRLPIRPDVARTVIDPVPVRDGLMGVRVGFDFDQRPVLSYLKFDESGNTQAYVARVTASGVRIIRVSDWKYRWDCAGVGTIRVEIDLGNVAPHDGQRLRLSAIHPGLGRHMILLDSATLRPASTEALPSIWPQELDKVQSRINGMQVRRAADLAARAGASVQYLLRWETLPTNRDLPRLQPPPPTVLKLYKVVSGHD